MIQYLSFEDVIIINQEILGLSHSQLRDEHLLKSALARPKASAFGQDAYPDLLTKAAALFHSLCKNHPFLDGNKRTATIVVDIFLSQNGYVTIWDTDDAFRFILGIAKGAHDVPQIAEWLAKNTRRTMPEDREQDSQI